MFDELSVPQEIPEPTAGDAGPLETTVAVAEDQELLLRLRAGDPTALDEVMKRHRRDVAAFFFPGRVRTREIAQDLAQETFLRVADYMTGPAFLRRDCTSVKNVVMRIAWCVYSQHVEDDKAERKFYAAFTIFPVDDPPWSDAEAAAKELDNITREAIEALPRKLRVVAKLFFLRGRTEGQIAAILHTTIGTVYGDVRRARKRLIETLRPYWKGKTHV
jgi:RNA polymerase sigma factor (sigma-70 family)